MTAKQLLSVTSVFGLMLGAMAPAVHAQTAASDTTPETTNTTTDSSADASTGEIVVTAQRRNERSVDVPISVTSLGAEQLQTANVSDLSDIAKITPALRFDNQAQFFQPTIRGIGTSITTTGGGSNVGIYVDGFYSPNPAAADLQLLNVSSIQVLKGPQGTLFGRNTTGGAILIQSSDPSTDTRGQAKVSYGRFNKAVAQGYLTYGISDRVAFDIEGLYSRGDNFQRNITTNKRDREYENWSLRMGLKADITDDVSVLFRYMHGDVNDPTSVLENTYVDPVFGVGAPNFVAPNFYTTDKNRYASGTNRRFIRSKNDVYQFTLKADLGFADLTSYSQYRKEITDASEDLDHTGSVPTIFQLGLPVLDKTVSQEFLLNSKPGGALQWTAGLFYLKNTDRYITFIDNATPAGPRIRLGGSSAPTSSYAAFFDGTYELSPQLFITAGLRYAHDTVDDAYFNPTFTNGSRSRGFSIKGDKITPRVVVRYKPTDESSIYASFSKGYKAAIIDVGGASGNRVAPENVNAYEVGFKYDDRAFSFETAAFYYDYSNLQVSLFKDAAAQIINAAQSEIYGLEGQFRYQLVNGFTINGGAAYVHARYKRFDNAPIYTRCPTVAGCGGGTSFFIPQGITLRDVPMQRTPEFTANLGASYKTPLAGGELALSGNAYYTTKFFFGPSGTQFPQKAYETLSARVQWTDPSDKYTIAAFGDNLSNSRYRTQVQYNNFGIGSTYNEPVTYGIELGAKF